MSANTTYPFLFLASDRRLWLFVRVGNTDWSLRVRDAVGTWGAEKLFISEVVQSYATPAFDKATNKFTIALNFNSDNAAYGNIKFVTLDGTTGEFFDANGGRGFISGAASANTKTLPITPSTVPITAAPATGYQYSMLDRNPDCTKILVQTRNSGDATDLPVYLWTRSAASDVFAEASYTKSAAIFNQGALTDSNTNLGARFEKSSNSVNRFYAARKLTIADDIDGAGVIAYYSLDKWESADGTAWTSTRLTTSRSMHYNPRSALNGDSTTPIYFSRFTSYTDYPTYTDGATIWLAPWLDRGAAKGLAETDDYFTRAGGTAPTALFKGQINALMTDLKERGLLTNMEALYLMPTETEQQRLAPLLGSKTLYGSAKPSFTAKQPVTYSTGLYYATGIVPGAGGSKLTHNAHYGMLGSSSHAQGSYDFGMSTFGYLGRNTSDQRQSRSSTNSVNTNSSTTAKGFRGLKRTNSAAYAEFNGNSTPAAVTQTSGAHGAGEIILGALNTNTAGGGAITAGSTCARTHHYYAFGGSIVDADAAQLRLTLHLHVSAILQVI